VKQTFIFSFQIIIGNRTFVVNITQLVMMLVVTAMIMVFMGMIFRLVAVIMVVTNHSP
jgi:hypothetical protein